MDIVYAQGKSCGNGTCQPSQGENSSTCPQDCAAPTSPPAATNTPVPTSPPSATNTPVPNPTDDPGGGSGDTGSSDGGDTSTSTGSSSSSGSSGSSSSNGGSSESSNPPSVTLFSSPGLTSDTTPSISGLATVSGSTILRVEYSTNGGSSWIFAQPTDGGYGGASEAFSFTTASLSDGSYSILVRATANNGKTATTSTSFQVSTVPPEIEMDLIFPNPSEDIPPTISGTVTQTALSIVSVQVSQDGGGNWTNATRSGNRFSINFDELEDGNYEIVARAIDAAGNIALSKSQILVVDTLPPVLGGSFFSIESRELPMDNSGVVYVPTDRSIQHIISTRGGVTEISIVGDIEGSYEAVSQSNLFSGLLMLDEPGEYTLDLEAIDGADNETDRVVTKLIAVPKGKIVDESGDVVNDVTLTIHYKNPYTKEWLIWDSSLYGGENPVLAQDGTFNFILPQGTYYLTASASGYRRFVSDIFNVDSVTIVSDEIELKQSYDTVFGAIKIPFLYMPSGGQIEVAEYSSDASNDTDLDDLSDIVVTTEDNDEIEFLETIQDLDNDKILLTFFSSWSTLSLEQMSIFNSFSESSPILTRGVNVQDSYYATQVFMKRGNYSFDYLVDEVGFLSDALGVSALPYHILIEDEKITAIHVGVLSESAYNEFIEE